MDNRPYKLEIIIYEDGCQVQKLTTKDSFNIEVFTNKGALKVDFKKWEEANQ